jgi:soluble lytic murein transglycosylase
MLPHVKSILAIALIAMGIGFPLTSSDTDPIGPFFSPIDPESFTEGDYVSAIREFERASRLNLVDPKERVNMARLYVVTREYEKALGELERVRELLGHETDAELEKLIVQLYLRLGVFDRALEYLIKNDGSDFLIGYCNERMSNWESALEYFSLEASLGVEFPDLASYHAAYCLYKLERYEEALAAFERFDDDFPLSVYLSFAEDLIPSCYEGMKQYRKAIHLRNDMMRKNPGLEPAMRYYVGRDYEELKDAVRARQEYVKVMTDYPGNHYALLSLDALKDISTIKGRMLYRAGRICYYHRDYSRAKDYLSFYTTKYPKGRYARHARHLLANCYLKLKMYTDAEAGFERLAKSEASERERARYLFDLAKAQDRLGRTETAAGSFEKVAKMKSSGLWDDAVYREGLIKEEQGRLEQAIRTYMKVTAGDYADNALYRAGTVAVSMEKYDLAREAFRKLIDSRADTGFRVAAEYWLAAVFEELDSLDTSLELYRSVAGSDPFGYYGYKSRARLAAHDQEDAPPVVTNGDVETWIASWASNASPLSAYEKARLSRGQMLLEAGLGDVGVSELDRINRGSAVNVYLLAKAYAQSGFDHKAIPLAKRIIRSALDSGVEDVPKELLRIAYPLSFLPSALEFSEAGTDPLLILAMIREESLFLPEAVSRAGAIGLMQIMPRTGKALASSGEWEGFEVKDLYRPRTSVSFGSRYVAEQLSEFKKLELAIAAYNAGPVAVRKWTRRFETQYTDRFLELIPYPETRVYVKRVLASWWTYQRIWSATSTPCP